MNGLLKKDSTHAQPTLISPHSNGDWRREKPLGSAREKSEKKEKPIKDVLTCGIGEDQSAVRKNKSLNSFSFFVGTERFFLSPKLWLVVQQTLQGSHCQIAVLLVFFLKRKKVKQKQKQKQKQKWSSHMSCPNVSDLILCRRQR